MIIIPAIDIIEGKCVRLSQGDYSRKKIYNSDPLDMAMRFQDAGLTHLHLVDLDGAKASHIVNYKVLEKIASKTRLVIDFGGGLKSDEDLKIAFNSGATAITGGSIAVKNPEIFLRWIQTYGNEKIILGADFKEDKIAVSGWTETSDIELNTFIKEYVDKGIKKTICTDVGKDGMLEGPSLQKYKEIMSQVTDLYLIASGGVSSMKDIEELAIAGIPAVITGKAIYENKITLEEIKRWSLSNKQ